MNQRSRRVVIYFAAEAINVNVNHVGCGVNPHFPDVVQNHGPRHHATFVAAKIFQQGKLLRGQLQASARPAAPRDAPSQAASRLTADAQIQFAGRRTCVRDFSILRAFGESKWLREVVVSALLQPADTFVYGAPGGQIRTGAALPWARQRAIKSNPSRSGRPRSMMKAS